jgi:hypothetical protein
VIRSTCACKDGSDPRPHQDEEVKAKFVKLRVGKKESFQEGGRNKIIR